TAWPIGQGLVGVVQGSATGHHDQALFLEDVLVPSRRPAAGLHSLDNQRRFKRVLERRNLTNIDLTSRHRRTSLNLRLVLFCPLAQPSSMLRTPPEPRRMVGCRLCGGIDAHNAGLLPPSPDPPRPR